MTYDRIEMNPAIMFGKPVIKGTRITVEHILRKLAGGMTVDEILADHPHLTPDDVYTVSLTASGPGGSGTLTRTNYITVSSGFVYTTTQRVISYTYDSLYRLTGADYSTGESFAYTYDPVGNRLQLTKDGGQVTNYVYDAANRLTSVNGVVYTWDDNGNLLNDGSRAYAYDHANRLTQVVSGTLTTQFAYNGVGDRVAKTVDGVTTGYVLDGSTGLTTGPAAGLTQVLGESTGGQQTAYLYGHDLLAQYDSGTWAYHVNDGLGSVRQLVDAAGEVQRAQSYDPFGNLLSASGSMGSDYGYTGEQWDASAGLVYLRARYYQPATGRFISKDPFPGYASNPQTLNRWSYALNNPANRVDPRGYLSNSVIAASFGVNNFEQVLTIFELKGRWGFLKLLQDAQIGDIVEIGQVGCIYKRAGSFEVQQMSVCPEKVTLGSLELPRFLTYLDNFPVRGDTPRNIADLRTAWRRDDYNWYFLNGGGPYPAIIGAPQYWRGGIHRLERDLRLARFQGSHCRGREALFWR